ncbi:MAG: hypothetical protein AAF264_13835 [Pseudomonadota bacterium]
MIISETHGVSFVHVPKCGGMTIKDQFVEIHDHPLNFETFADHPVLGWVRPAHLPLWALRDHYPDVIESLSQTCSFALCRDPHDRFESALAQYFRKMRKVRINELPRREVLAVARDVVAHIAATPALSEGTYCHFIRQTDFVTLDGDRLVERVFPLARIDALAAEMAALTGRSDAGAATLRSNQTLDFRLRGSEGWLRRASGVAKRLLPIGAHARLKAGVKALFVRGGSRHAGFSRQETDLDDFIRDYYAEDAVLFADATARGVSDRPQAARA